MVRGVNKTVIEVNCVDHAVFERAIFFVRPNARRPEYELRRDADEFIALTGLEDDWKPRRPFRSFLLWGGIPLLAAGLGLLTGIFLL